MFVSVFKTSRSFRLASVRIRNDRTQNNLRKVERFRPGNNACASTGPIRSTWWHLVRRYHKQQQGRSEPLDGMFSDVTTNSSREDLNYLMECCQTLPQTAAGQIWTTWWNVVRRYHKQQQGRSEPLDGMLSDVTTKSSRTDLNNLMECCQTLPQRAAGQIWTTWWNVARRYQKQQQDRSEPLDGSRHMLSQTDAPAMSLNLSRHKGHTKPAEVLRHLSKGQRSLYQPNIQLF